MAGMGAIQASNVICWEQTTKSGKSQLINLRDRLFELEVEEQQRASGGVALLTALTVGAKRDAAVLRMWAVVAMMVINCDQSR